MSSTCRHRGRTAPSAWPREPTWRGYRDDAVEHDVIGPALPALLDAIRVPYRRMVDPAYDATWLLASAHQLSGPVALLITEPS